MWFNHVIRIQNASLIGAEHLWSFITRGAMVVCVHNHVGVDIIIPLCLKTGSLSRKTISAILIQVKNASKYGKKVDTKLFDALCPFRVGLFDDNDEDSTPRPVIRMVFALASKESDIDFPKVDESCNEFTAFDIWCAGLSCFPVVGKDDLASYQILLERSLRPHDAFDLGELVKDQYLDDETRQVRGLRRRRIAALTMDHDEHRMLHL